MIFRPRTLPRAVPALPAILFSLFLILSCNLAREEGRTYINVRKDASWAAFDSLDITWKDSASGAGGTLFSGDPADLSETNKLPADGYQGRKITVTFKGYRDGALVYEERRGFNGNEPGKVTKVIIPIDSSPGVPKPKTPRLGRLKALPDSIVSIRDSISFSSTAILDSGSLKSYAWSYESGGEPFAYGEAIPLSGKSAAIAGGHRYAETGTYVVALKVVSDSDSVAVARMKVQVLRDPPTADAGRDTAVYPSAAIALRGTAKDGLGTIVKTEWKIGNAEFAPAGPDTSFQAPSLAQDLVVVFRATDDDGQTGADTLIVHVIPEDESNLTDLGVSHGTLSPQFSPGILSYADTVPNGVTAIVLTPVGSGAIKVKEAVTASGKASAPIDLDVGENAIPISVQYGAKAAKTYILKVYRLPPSLGADLKGLALSAGPIVPEFGPDIVVYTLSLANSVDSTLVTATTVAAGAALAINRQPAVSGTGFSVKIPTGVSVISIVVATPGGSLKTYTVIVTREKNGNSDLSALVPSADSLRPAFHRNTTAYSLAVGNDVGGITPFTLKPEMASPVSAYTLTVNGSVVETADPEAPIPLRVGLNTLEFKVRAENGDSKTYTVSVTRSTNGNAALASLTVSPGLLDSAFRPGDTSYAVAIGNASASITITATPAASTSSLTVNGTAVAAGEAYEAIGLKVGETAIPIRVTAENQATRTYWLAVSRARNGNMELSGLVPSVGTLDPEFRPGVSNYSFQAPFADSLVRITPTAADSLAIVQVNGDAVPSGSPSGFVKVQVGANPNRFIVVVTAENQSQKVYNVSVNRAPNSQAALKSLAVSQGTLAQKNPFEYADTVPHGTASVTLVPMASDPNATVTVNSAAVAGGEASEPIPLSIGDNTILCVVTAQDGKTRTQYAIHVTRLALLTRYRKLGSEVSVLDSAEIPLGRAYAHSAPAATGFHFVKWTTLAGSVAFGDSAAAATTATLSGGDARIQAQYDTNTYALSVTASDGTVAKSPDRASYIHGQSVVLTVTPSAGFRFSSWSDGNTANPRTLSMISNTTLSATCTAIPTYTLTLAVDPPGTGGVTADPPGPTYYSGTVVNLEPNAQPGYHFTGWSGDLTAVGGPVSITMAANKSVTAHFAPDYFSLTVAVNGPSDIPSGCSTTPSGTVQVANGAATALKAVNCKRSVAPCGSGVVWLYYDFTGWSTVSGSPSIANPAGANTTVTLGSGDAAIRANYANPRSVCE